MTYDEHLAFVRDFSRSVVDSCLAELERASVEAGSTSSRTNAGDLYEQTGLTFLLLGLMDRAQHRGVPWADIVADAGVMMTEIAGLPVTPVVQ